MKKKLLLLSFITFSMMIQANTLTNEQIVEKVTEAQESAELAQQAAEEAENRVEELEEQVIEKMDDINKTVEEKIREINNVKSTVEQKIDTAKQEFNSELDKKINGSNGLKTSLEKDINSKLNNAKIEIAKHNKTILDEKEQEINAKFTQQINQNKNLKAAINELEQINKANEEQLEEHEITIDKHEEGIRKNLNKILSNQNKLLENSKKIDKHTRKLKEQSERLSYAEANVEENAERIEEIDETLQSYNQNINKNSKDIKKNKENIEENKDKIGDNSTAIKYLKQNKADKIETEKSINSLKERIHKEEKNRLASNRILNKKVDNNTKQIEVNEKLTQNRFNSVKALLETNAYQTAINTTKIKENKSLILANTERLDAHDIRLSNVERRSEQAINGVSAAVAMANLPTVGNGSVYSNNLSAAYGFFGGSHSVAIGLSGITANDRVSYKISTAFNTKGDIAFGLGLGINFGHKKVDSSEVIAKQAQTIKNLQERLEKLEKMMNK